MALLRAMVSLNRDTNLPEDVSVNTWHFATTEATPYPNTRSLVDDALTNFYHGIDSILSSVLTGLGSIKYYDLADPEPRQPLGAPTPLELTVDTGIAPYPEEAAVCLSFKGAPVSGVSQARRRGRIYLGPIAAIGQVTAGRLLVRSDLQSQILGAGAQLLLASQASPLWDWVIYSPTNAAIGGEPESWYTPVASGWVDNAFDTQRRRGPQSTSRLLF